MRFSCQVGSHKKLRPVFRVFPPFRVGEKRGKNGGFLRESIKTPERFFSFFHYAEKTASFFLDRKRVRPLKLKAN
jgi:hypothetical protein